MHTYTVQEAKDLLSNLVDQCTQGETILIAKEGKPLVKLVPVDHEPAQHQRLGFGRASLWYLTILIGWRRKDEYPSVVSVA